MLSYNISKLSLDLLLAPYSDAYLSYCFLFYGSVLLENKQEVKFGGVMSILNTHFILMFYLVFYVK